MNEVIRALKRRQVSMLTGPEQVREEDRNAVWRPLPMPPAAWGPAEILVAVQDPATIARLSQLNAAVMGTKTDPFYGAPTVVVVLADQSRATWLEDGSLAMGNLMLAAHALGLGSCWVHRAREVYAGAEGQELLRQWGIQGNYVGVAHCLLGYPDGPLPEPKPRREHRIYRR